MSTPIVVLIIIGLSLVGAVGDYLLKLAGHGVKFMEVRWFILGLIVYSSTAIGWFYVLKYIKLGSLGVVYGVSTVLFLFIGGLLFFKEEYTTLEYLGVALGVISLILMSRIA